MKTSPASPVAMTLLLALGALHCSSTDSSNEAPPSSHDAGDESSSDAPGADAPIPDAAPDAEADSPVDLDAEGDAVDEDAASPALVLEAPVLRYDYNFDITTAEASSRISLEVPAQGGNVYEVPCKLASVDEVTWNDAPALSHALQNEILTVQGTDVLAGSTLEIGTHQQVPESTAFSLDVGFSRTNDLAGGEFSYLLSWVSGCARFGPCDDHPSRLAEFHIDVAHDPGQVVLCPGQVTAGQTLTRCIIEGTLAPTYSAFAIAADPLWERQDYLSAAGVDIVFYEVPGGQLASSLDPASVAEYLNWVTGLFGPMPYGAELRIAGGPTAWLGFEHPANIILHERLPLLTGMPYADSMMHVLVHEIVHQWAGARTTLATAQDFVWKEGTAEYLTYVFEDEFRPVGEAQASLAYWDEISLQSDYHPRPTDDPPPAVNVFYGDVYGPGPMLLFVQLETMLGRPVVLTALQSFLAAPGARTVADLQASLEQASGEDLSAYFDAWVYGAGKPEWPTFAVELTQDVGDVAVTVTQQNPSATVYPCMVEVELKGATKSARVLVDFGFAPSSAAASATVAFDEPIVGYELDPDHRLVGWDAANKTKQVPPKKKVWIL